MNQAIHVSTTYDEQICSSLVYLMLYKLRKWPRYMLMALGLATAVIAGMIMLAEGRVSALPFLVMILGSMLCTAAIFLKQLATRMLVASYGKQYPTFCYTFGADEISVAVNAREQQDSYAYVLRLLEMSGLLFMFMKDGQVYILRQRDVTVGYDRLKAL
ncbi:MAG: hypothetical protein IJ350_06865, partial [Clostridia bacterium]|nr:hypothetical protein [Clostridia bacterium]